jgi:hypothetical protein
LLRNLVLLSTLVAALSHTAQGAITLSALNQNVVVGTNNVRVGIFANGPDALNGLQFVVGLNDGGPLAGGTETARITAVSLDQTIWDVNSTVGVVSTPALLELTTPNIPNAATAATFTGATNSTSVVANGALAFFTVDVSSKNIGDTIVVNPSLLANFAQAIGPTLNRIDLLSTTGTITIVAVPEPSSIGLLVVGLGAAVMRRRRRSAA